MIDEVELVEGCREAGCHRPIVGTCRESGDAGCAIHLHYCDVQGHGWEPVKARGQTHTTNVVRYWLTSGELLQVDSLLGGTISIIRSREGQIDQVYVPVRLLLDALSTLQPQT